jgi:hypothetical protein
LNSPANLIRWRKQREKKIRRRRRRKRRREKKCDVQFFVPAA